MPRSGSDGDSVALVGIGVQVSGPREPRWGDTHTALAPFYRPTEAKKPRKDALNKGEEAIGESEKQVVKPDQTRHFVQHTHGLKWNLACTAGARSPNSEETGEKPTGFDAGLYLQHPQTMQENVSEFTLIEMINCSLKVLKEITEKLKDQLQNGIRALVLKINKDHLKLNNKKAPLTPRQRREADGK